MQEKSSVTLSRALPRDLPASQRKLGSIAAAMLPRNAFSIFRGLGRLLFRVLIHIHRRPHTPLIALARDHKAIEGHLAVGMIADFTDDHRVFV
jgi:hypothetical protein